MGMDGRFKKKAVAAACLLVVALMTVSCGKNENSSAIGKETSETEKGTMEEWQDNTSQMDETESEKEQKEELPSPIVELKDYSRDVTSGEAVVLKIQETLPQISFPENEESGKKMQDFYDEEKKEFDKISGEFEKQCVKEYDIQQEAARQYWKGHEISREYYIGRADSVCVSIKRDDYKDAGEDGKTVSSYSRNFDPSSGLQLLAADVFTSEKDAQVFFAHKLIEVLEEEQYQGIATADYKAKAEYVFTEDTWYLTETGIHLLCNPGIVTSEDAQVIDIEVPYEEVECLEARFMK